MKKFIGLLLTCTAFAYSGERVVMDLPPEICAYSDEDGDYRWGSADNKYIEVDSTRLGPYELSTVEQFLEPRDEEQIEILDQDDHGVTILVHDEEWPDDPDMIVRLILSQTHSHIIRTNSVEWFPYVQSARVGEAPDYRYSECAHWASPVGDDWERCLYFDYKAPNLEALASIEENIPLESHEELWIQGEEDTWLHLLSHSGLEGVSTLGEYIDLFLEEYEGLEVVEQSDSEALLVAYKDDCFSDEVMRLVLRGDSFHMAYTIGLGSEKETNTQLVTELELTH